MNIMMSYYTDEQFTAQGRDTPVPVGDLGDRAGPTRPSASDCSAPLVGNQAGVLGTVSGTHGVTEKRRLRLQLEGLVEGTRSTPVSPNTGVLDLTWDETSARSVKKKKQDHRRTQEEPISPKQVGSEALATKLRGVIERIGAEVRVVTDAAKERNTKKEVKEAAVKLTSLMSQLTTAEAQVLFQRLGRGSGEFGALAEGRRADWETRIRKVEEELKLLKQTNDQLRAENTELRERNEALEEGNARLKEKVKELEATPGGATKRMEEGMFGGGTYEDFAAVEGLIWPKSIHRAVIFTAESPYTANRDMDMLVLQGGGEANGNSEGILDRYPDIEEIEGKIGAISIVTRTIEGGGATNERERWVIRARIENGDEDLFDSLNKVREILQNGGRTKVGLDAPVWDKAGTSISKMLEYIFRGTGIVCGLYTRDNPDPGRGNKRRGAALILRQEGKGYSEALRNFKGKVKPGSSVAKAIRTIRETREGNMVVVLDKDNQHMADDLRREIQRTGDIKILKDINDEDATVFVSGVDGVTIKEEVREAICDNTGLEANRVKVGDLRPTFGGNQTAVVNMPKEEAEVLLRSGGIRIGLSWCPIREKVGVTRCFRCWQYGHLGRDCKASTDESKLCRKCGEGGHIARDCASGEKCLTCKKEGHTSGSGRCPEFRKAVARERLKRKLKRSY